MRLTESVLKQMIKEELGKVLKEQAEVDQSDIPTARTGTASDDTRGQSSVIPVTDNIVKLLNGKTFKAAAKFSGKPLNLDLVVSAKRDEKSQGAGIIDIDIASKQKLSDIGLPPSPAWMGGDRTAYNTSYKVNVGVVALRIPHKEVIISQGPREVGKAFPTADAILKVIQNDIAAGKDAFRGY